MASTFQRGGAALLTAAVLCAASCSGGPGSPADDARQTSTDGQPDAFVDRVPLPLCAPLALTHTLLPISVPCLDAARAAGKGAELSVTELSIEGDPISTYYRVLPGEPGLEVFIDSTADKFGTQVWTLARCPAATGLRDLGQCTSETLD